MRYNGYCAVENTNFFLKMKRSENSKVSLNLNEFLYTSDMKKKKSPYVQYHRKDLGV